MKIRSAVIIFLGTLIIQTSGAMAGHDMGGIEFDPAVTSSVSQYEAEMVENKIT